jgi:phage shock protein A
VSPPVELIAPPIQEAIDAAVEDVLAEVLPRLDSLENAVAGLQQQQETLQHLQESHLTLLCDTVAVLEMVENRVQPDQLRSRVEGLRTRMEQLLHQTYGPDP